MTTVLHLYVDDERLAAQYTDRSACRELPEDSGFDLITVSDVVVKEGELAKIEFMVRGAMVKTLSVLPDIGNLAVLCQPVTVEQRQPYFVTPRSSFTKTPLLMQNSPAVIDKGFNGLLRVQLRLLPGYRDPEFTIPAGSCLFQIVLPSLEPFMVQLKQGEPPATVRGEGGFGSTGNTCGSQ